MKITDIFFGEQISVDQFLAEYWQKKPLLLRQAIPGFHSPVSPETLAGLACESIVESRLVIEKDDDSPWCVKQGPFSEDDFLHLPKTHWTLLVQEANKHIPELSDLLARFNFLPSWWFDDVMISYAPDQGSVGPHFDYYDVFLFQAQGRKRWQINTQNVSEDNMIADIDLRIMRDFEAEHDWVLEPGDMLYLPPGVAHHGVAMGDSLTYSIGYRAISKAEMITSFMEQVVDGLASDSHLVAGELKKTKHVGEISAQTLVHVADMIKAIALTDTDIKRWFGRFVTEPKGCYQPEFPDEDIDVASLLKNMESGHKLYRGEHSRFNFIRNADGSVYLYIDSEEHVLAGDLAGLAEMICDRPYLTAVDLAATLNHSAALTFLVQLYNQGQLYMVDE